jgi:hypothetical protein
MSATTQQQWVCPTCRQRNPFEADICAGCQLSFSAQLRVSPTPTQDRATRYAVGLRELVIVLGLFVLWRVASSVSIGGTDAALARGRWIYHVERMLGVGNEVDVQAGVLGHPLVVQLLDLFYLAAHIGSLVVFLPWLFIRHRAQYARWRNTIAVFTLLSLLVQLISVAPPRLLPQYGFVDTAVRYKQSAYTALGQGMVGQLSSMPSIHVGWAIAIAIAVITVSTSKWRWLIVLHPIATCYVVVATANHFWLDGVAAAMLLGIVLAAQAYGLQRYRTWTATCSRPMTTWPVAAASSDSTTTSPTTCRS